MTRTRFVAAWCFVGVLAGPRGTDAQMRLDVTLPTPTSIVSITRCGPLSADYEGAWSELRATASLDPEAARRRLSELEGSLSAMLDGRREDAELRYVLAAVAGARAEVEVGRGQIEAAMAAHGRAQDVLELDPAHPGAKHLIGRLNLEVLRMGRVKRFLATRVLGGGELAGATWERARAFLEAGALGDPCSPDHHYQLARLYAETGDGELARDRLRAVLHMVPASARDSLVATQAAALMAALEGRSR